MIQYLTTKKKNSGKIVKNMQQNSFVSHQSSTTPYIYHMSLWRVTWLVGKPLD